jgi:hypothetical protein
VPKSPTYLPRALLKRFMEALGLILVLATALAQVAAPPTTMPSTAPVAAAAPVGTSPNQASPVIPSHITVEMKSAPTSSLGTWSAIIVAIIAALASIGAAIYSATAVGTGPPTSAVVSMFLFLLITLFYR